MEGCWVRINQQGVIQSNDCQNLNGINRNDVLTGAYHGEG